MLIAIEEEEFKNKYSSIYNSFFLYLKKRKKEFKIRSCEYFFKLDYSNYTIDFVDNKIVYYKNSTQVARIFCKAGSSYKEFKVDIRDNIDFLIQCMLKNQFAKDSNNKSNIYITSKMYFNLAKFYGSRLILLENKLNKEDSVSYLYSLLFFNHE